ncbi:MAG: hypothetical protein M3082_02900 [Candidatus Dormibacteraeota bacterium]|nr:hypothetical protein [Candidatus Dormibacteraeota bacterium]
MAEILVGTTDGLHRFDASGNLLKVEHAGRVVTTLAPEGWELWAILDGKEVVHTAGIDWWFHVAGLRGLRGNCIADTRAGVIVGTSDAHLYRVAGKGLERVRSFARAPGRNAWFTPWGGPPDTRSITEDDDTVYVNVHVGGVLRSSNNGESWEPTIDIAADIHRVTTGHERVYAAGANGLSVSQDKGETWTLSDDGLRANYCRSVTVCGDTVLISASAGPRGSHSGIYRSDVTGSSFERSSQGLPEWFGHNIDSLCLDAFPDGSLAAFGTEDGRLFASVDQGTSWSQFASGLPEVTRVQLAR